MRSAAGLAVLVFVLRLGDGVAEAGPRSGTVKDRPPVRTVFNPFSMPKEMVQERVHTIALRAVRVPPNTRKMIGPMFESLIAQGLQEQGYQTLPPNEFERIWREMSERLGGIYNPGTGESYEERHDAAWQHTTRDLARRLSADAVLDARVVAGEIPLRWGLRLTGFYWFAADEIVQWRGEGIGASESKHMPQKVLGTYLNVSLYDLSGARMYAVTSPIEWTKVFIARSYEERDQVELYLDDERNRDAVAKTLRPLGSPTGTK